MCDEEHISEKSLIGPKVVLYFLKVERKWWEVGVNFSGDEAQHSKPSQVLQGLSLHWIEWWEVLIAKSSLWIFLNSHSIPLFGAVNCIPKYHSRGGKGGKWVFHSWMWASAPCHFSQCLTAFLAEIYVHWLCPWFPAGHLTNMWTQNTIVKWGMSEVRGSKWKRRKKGEWPYAMSSTPLTPIYLIQWLAQRSEEWP